LRGEAFAFEAYSSKLKVNYDGRPAFVSQVHFGPESSLLQRTGAWGKHTHWGMFGAFGVGGAGALRELFSQVLQDHSRVLGGVSLAARAGLTVSMLGNRAQDLQAAAEDLRRAARSRSV
jgi:urease accessory protein